MRWHDRSRSGGCVFIKYIHTTRVVETNEPHSGQINRTHTLLNKTNRYTANTIWRYIIILQYYDRKVKYMCNNNNMVSLQTVRTINARFRLLTGNCSHIGNNKIISETKTNPVNIDNNHNTLKSVSISYILLVIVLPIGIYN